MKNIFLIFHLDKCCNETVILKFYDVQTYVMLFWCDNKIKFLILNIIFFLFISIERFSKNIICQTFTTCWTIYMKGTKFASMPKNNILEQLFLIHWVNLKVNKFCMLHSHLMMLLLKRKINSKSCGLAIEHSAHDQKVVGLIAVQS